MQEHPQLRLAEGMWLVLGYSIGTATIVKSQQVCLTRHNRMNMKMNVGLLSGQGLVEGSRMTQPAIDLISSASFLSRADHL